MSAGRRDVHMTIQRMVEARDASGGVINTPGFFAAAWARFEPLSGRELLAGGVIQTEVDSRATFDALDVEGVTTDMRALASDDGTIYDIRAVRAVAGRSREIELLLRERRQ